MALGVCLLPGVAAAMVSQPSGEVMPQPTNPLEITIVTSRGFPADALTLAGLFKYFHGGADAAIDPFADAQTTPGTFSPACGLTAAIVLKGGACRNALGWYNATEPATLPATIYPFVPATLMAAPPNGISCADNDFCPLATRTNTQVGHTWSLLFVLFALTRLPRRRPPLPRRSLRLQSPAGMEKSASRSGRNVSMPRGAAARAGRTPGR